MTDKERAQAYREAAKALEQEKCHGSADWLSDKADRLDPPEPEIPDGTLCELWKNGSPIRVGYLKGRSLTPIKGREYYSGSILIKPDMDIRPVRTVEPGSVVLSLAEAEQILPALPLTSPISRIVCGAIAKAEQEVSE